MIEQVHRSAGHDVVVRLVCAGAASEEDYVRKVSSIATAFKSRLAKHALALKPAPPAAGVSSALSVRCSCADAKQRCSILASCSVLAESGAARCARSSRC
jgi:hypothetical protein